MEVPLNRVRKLLSRVRDFSAERWTAQKLRELRLFESPSGAVTDPSSNDADVVLDIVSDGLQRDLIRPYFVDLPFIMDNLDSFVVLIATGPVFVLICQQQALVRYDTQSKYSENSIQSSKKEIFHSFNHEDNLLLCTKLPANSIRRSRIAVGELILALPDHIYRF